MGKKANDPKPSASESSDDDEDATQIKVLELELRKARAKRSKNAKSKRKTRAKLIVDELTSSWSTVDKDLQRTIIGQRDQASKQYKETTSAVQAITENITKSVQQFEKTHASLTAEFQKIMQRMADITSMDSRLYIFTKIRLSLIFLPRLSADLDEQKLMMKGLSKNLQDIAESMQRSMAEHHVRAEAYRAQAFGTVLVL